MPHRHAFVRTLQWWPQMDRVNLIFVLLLISFTKGAAEVVSCILDKDTGTTAAVFYQHKSEAFGSRDACLLHCFSLGTKYGVFYGANSCYCGNTKTTDNECRCPDLQSNSEPQVGSEVCDGFYIPNAFQVTMDIILNENPMYSTNTNITFTVTTVGTVQQYRWDFGDGTVIDTTTGEVSHSYTYATIHPLKVTVSTGSGTDTKTFPIKVLDSIKSTSIYGSSYLDSTTAEDFRLSILLKQGTDTVIKWTRTDPAGNFIQGQYCPEGQTAVRSKCLTIIDAEVLNLKEAKNYCEDRNGAHLTFDDQRHVQEIIDALNINGIGVYLTSANLKGDFYEWYGTNQLAYFTIADVGDVPNGDCVLLSSTGFQATDCSAKNPFICQFDPPQCPHGGEYSQDTDTCFLMSSDMLSWTAAESKCQSIHSGGKLAIISNDLSYTFITSSFATKNSPENFWIGLNDQDNEGRFMWTDSTQMTSTFTKWASLEPNENPSPQDCVAAFENSNELFWKDEDCQLQKNYLCQYPNGDFVSQVQGYIAGNGQLQHESQGVRTLTSERPSETNDETTTLIFPGYWFHDIGTLTHIRIANLVLAGITELHIHVYRPVCPSGEFLISPGCQDLPSPFAVCHNMEPTCQTATSQQCRQGAQYCQLTGACQSVFKLCNCHSGARTNCGITEQQAERHTGTPPRYKLIHTKTVSINGGVKQDIDLTVSTLRVEKNDVLGIQYLKTNTNVIKCVTDSTSQKRQNIFKVSRTGWSVKSEIINVTNIQWIDDQVCEIQAVYNKRTFVSSPTNIKTGGKIETGSYTFTATLKTPLTIKEVKKVIKVQDPVKEAVIMNPDVFDAFKRTGSIGTYLLESGVTTDFLVKISMGSNVSVSCPGSVSSQFSSNCPSAYQLTICATQSTSDQYAIISVTRTANASVEYQSLDFTIKNKVSEELLLIDIKVEERIINLYMPEHGYLSTGRQETLHIMAENGTHMSYNWTITGNKLYTDISSPSVQHTFTRPGNHSVLVTAKNNINSAQMETVATVYSPASATNLQIGAPPAVATQEPFEFSVFVDVNPLSFIMLFVDFGDFQNETRDVSQGESQTLTANFSHTYATEGMFEIKVIITDKTRPNIQVFLSSSIKAKQPVSGLTLEYDGPKLAGTQLKVTATVLTGTDVQYQCKSGEQDSVFNTKQTSNSCHFQYSTKGSYNVTVLAEDGILILEQHILVTVLDPDLVIVRTIQGPDCGSSGKEVIFISDVLSVEPSLLTYIWDFGDGSVRTEVGLQNVSHVFTNPGDFVVTVTARNDKNIQDNATTSQCVQEEVGGVVLATNSPVPLTRGQEVEAKVLINVSKGSDYKYNWVYPSGGKGVEQPMNIKTLRYATPGLYNGSLTVFNNVSEETVHFIISVQEVITDLKLNNNMSISGYAVADTSYNFDASILTGSDVIYIWSWTTNASFSNNSDTNVDFIFPVGVHRVNVTAKNDVSILVSSQLVYSNIPLSHVTIESLAPPATKQTVTFFANVQTGTLFAVISVWTICQTGTTNCDVSPNIHGVSYDYQFQTVGSYEVKLLINNGISQQEVIKQITVAPGFEGLEIRATDLKMGHYSVENQVLNFEGYVQTGDGVSYNWTLIRDDNGAVLKTGEGVTFSHSFGAAGNYTLEMLAYNTLCHLTKELSIEIVEPILGLEIIGKQGNYTLQGHHANFEAIQDSGTITEYMWTINQINESGVVSAFEGTNIMSHVFNETGEYEVILVASNRASSQEISFAISVVPEILDISIEVATSYAPYVPVGKAVKYSLKVAAAPHLLYMWHFHEGHPPYISFAPQVFYAFKSPGQYSVEVNITNVIVDVYANTTVYIEEPVSDVYVTTPKTTPGREETIEILVSARGSNKKYEWEIEGEKIVKETHVLSYAFKDPGKKIVNVTVYNNVSSVLGQIELNVRENITDLNYKGCCETWLPNHKEISLFATMTSEGPVQFSWEFVDTGIILQMNPLVYTFEKTGDYPIILKATGDFGEISLDAVLRVEDPILNVSLQADKDLSEIYANQDVVFTAITKGGTNVIYSWYVNNVLQPAANLSSFTLFCEEPGDTKINVTASNSVSFVSATRTFRVIRILCPEPLLFLIGDATREEFRSRSLDVEMLVELDCTRVSYQLEYQWKVFTNTCDANSENEVALPSAISTNTPLLHLAERTLEYGEYCIIFSAHFVRTPVKSEEHIDVKILPTPLHAIIDGGSMRSFPVHQVGLLDGTASFDPDLSKAEDSQLFYKWTCVENVVPIEKNDDSCFPPQYTSRVSIPGNSLKPNSIYNITLTVSRPYRVNDTFSQMLHILPESVPVVRIECASCREKNVYTVSNSQHIKLLGACLKCHPLYTPIYKWTVVRDDGKPVVLDLTTTTTGDSHQNLAVRRQVLDNDHAYIFNLNITDTLHHKNGFAQLELKPNQPPSGGSCNITPLEVVALDRQVTFACKSWIDNDDITNSPLTYEFRVINPATNDWYLIYKGSQSSGSTFLSPWIDNEEQVIMALYVADALDSKTLALKTNVTVKSPEVPGNLSRTQYLYEHAKVALSILKLMHFPKRTLQYITALTFQLNHESEKASHKRKDEDYDKATRIELRKFILGTMTETISISTVYDVQQTARALMLLSLYKEEFPQENDTYLTMVNFLDQMVTTILKIASPAWLTNDFVPETLLTMAANMIEAINMEDTTSYSDTTTKQAIVETTMNMSGLILYTLSLTQIPDEQPFIFDTGYFYSKGQRTTANSIWLNFDGHGCSVRLPRNLLADLDQEEVFQLVTTLENNPYSWGYLSGHPVSSKVVNIIFNFPNGSLVKVQDLPPEEEVEIEMVNVKNFKHIGRTKRAVNDIDTQTNGEPNQNIEMVHYNSYTFQPKQTSVSQINTSVNLKNGGLSIELHATVLPSGEELTVDMSPFLNVVAYLAKGYEPTKYKYDSMINLTAEDQMSGRDHRNYTFFIHNRLGHPESDYFLTLTNMDPVHEVNITVGTYYSSCVFYNEQTSSWDPSGCRPTDRSNLDMTVCSCNHLTGFGASVEQLTIDLDFRDLTKLDFGNNPIVIIMVSIIAFFYLIGMVLAKFWDLEDVAKISVVPLCGKGGFFRYEIVVITGRMPGAGTTAHVGIKLYGETGRSGARHLARPKAFRRNGEDQFLIATETSLGDLYRIVVWHDNTGISPAWYCSRVIVRDLQTNKKYYFLAESWLSLTEEKGKLDVDVIAASAEELSKFKNVFQAEKSKGFAEQHLWMSLWDRPVYSRFTRVQRLTCCVTLIYTFMCVNAMWFAVIRAPDEKEILLGISDFSWKDIVVGMVTSIIIFPINFGIMQIFRKRELQIDKFFKRRVSAAETIEIEAMCDLSQAGSSFASYGNGFPRENTTDSIGIAGGLHRTNAKLKLLGDESLEEIMKDSSDGGSFTREDLLKRQSSQGDGRMWWSYDSILQWPDKMPGAMDSRQSSAASFRPKPVYKPRQGYGDRRGSLDLSDDDTLTAPGVVETEKNKPEMKSVLKRKPTKRRVSVVSISESIEELFEEDYWASLEPGYKKENKKMNNNNTEKRRVSISNKSDEVIPLDNMPGHITRDRSRDSFKSVSTLQSQNSSSLSEGKFDALSSDRHLMGKTFNARDEATLDGQRNEKREGTSTGATVRKTRSKGKIADRWAQIIIPSEIEPTKNSEDMFELEDNFSISRSGTRSSGFYSRTASASSRLTRTGTVILPFGSQTKKQFMLPRWFLYVAYALCAVLSGISIIITLLYGHKFGRDVALRWLLALFAAFIESIFILEPLKVIALALLLTLMAKKMDDEDSDRIDNPPILESNEKLKDVKMKPLGGYALLQAKEEGRKVTKMYAIFRQILAYFCLILLVLSINYMHHSNDAYRMKEHVKQTFMKTKFDGSKDYTLINSGHEWWLWATTTLAPRLHMQGYDKGATHPYLLGQARIRQIRSKIEDNCIAEHQLHEIDSFKDSFKRGCYSNDGWREDTDFYLKGWNNSLRSNVSWSYQNAQELESITQMGTIQSYHGGGYVQKLSRIAVSIQLMRSLRRNSWIDRGTRAVLVEFNMYSQNINHFSVVTLMAEFPITGGVVTSYHINTLHLLRFIPGHVDALMVCECLLALVVAYMIVCVAMNLCHHRMNYFMHWWNWIELVTTGITMASVILYIITVYHSTTAFEKYKNNKNVYTSFQWAEHYHYVWKCLNATLIFLLTLVMVKQLRFFKFLSIYSRTLSSASWSLIGFAFVMTLGIFMFSQLGHQCYGSVNAIFSQMGSSFAHMFTFVKGPDLDGMSRYNKHLTTLYLLCYLTFVNIFMLGLMIAILQHAYHMVKQQLYYHNTLEIQDYEMIEFTMKWFKKFLGITKPKPAFRKVKFMGMPSLSTVTDSTNTRPTSSNASSTGTDPYGLECIEEDGDSYLNGLLDRATITWDRMLRKLDQVEKIEKDEQLLDTALEQKIEKIFTKDTDDVDKLIEEEMERNNIITKPKRLFYKRSVTPPCGPNVSSTMEIANRKPPIPRRRISLESGLKLRSGTPNSMKKEGSLTSRRPASDQSRRMHSLTSPVKDTITKTAW